MHHKQPLVQWELMLDMDGDGFDDLVILDQSEDLHVLYQGDPETTCSC